MAGRAFVDIDALEEKWLTNGDYVDPEFLLELTDHSGSRCFSELDTAPQGPHTFHPTSVIIDLCRQQPSVAPMEAQRFHADSGWWSPCVHLTAISHGDNDGKAAMLALGTLAFSSVACLKVIQTGAAYPFSIAADLQMKEAANKGVLARSAALPQRSSVLASDLLQNGRR